MFQDSVFLKKISFYCYSVLLKENIFNEKGAM